jgi:hypothetical protein
LSTAADNPICYAGSIHGSRPVLVMCAHAPPFIGGTPSVMYELLRHFPSESLMLVTKRRGPEAPRDDRILNIETMEIGGVGNRVQSSTLQLLLLPIRVYSVLRGLKRHKTRPRSILAVYPDLDFLLCALVVSRLLELPIFVYLHDCIIESTPSLDRLVARYAEHAVFRTASRVYAISELMQDYYRTKGRDMDLLRHCVDTRLIRTPDISQCPDCPRIGFAGTIYQANDLGIQDLIAAKDLLHDKLKIFVATSGKSKKVLEESRLVSKIDSVLTFSRHADLVDFLSGCDILFVPMNFDSFYRKDLLTIFPTKVTDYWLAQRPILVYGPRDYKFVIQAEVDGYGESVTTRGEGHIASAIAKICESPTLRRSLVDSSRRVLEYHNSAVIAEMLMRSLEIGLVPHIAKDVDSSTSS